MLKIGITFRITNAETYDEKRDSLSHDWPVFLEKIQAIPIWIPNSVTNLEQFLQEVDLDGIILSGGDNIGQTPERDKTEIKLIDYAINNNIPIFGVCRGMQVLNKFFGGEQEFLNTDTHVGNNHSIKIKNESFSKLINSTDVLVNSYHRNIISVDSLAETLTPFAFSDIDNTVEAFIHSTLPIIGVMWHPEREQKLFDEKIVGSIFKNK
tara:strand:+ start:243 stop:869 length:627 start_codon:yes stop_codon:yes gene_type:complete